MRACVRVRRTVSLLHASARGCRAPEPVSCLTKLEPCCPRPNQRSETLQIIHFNDVYEVEPRSREPVGGVARFIGKLKTYPEACVLFSGDSLAPSLMSTVTKGEHMVCMSFAHALCLHVHTCVANAKSVMYAACTRCSWLGHIAALAQNTHSMYTVFFLHVANRSQPFCLNKKTWPSLHFRHSYSVPDVHVCAWLSKCVIADVRQFFPMSFL
jgi:hypothetical protein